MSSTDLSQLAWDLDSHGFAGRDAAVRYVERSARVAGLSPVVIAVFAGSAEPEVARMRAFGVIAAGLARLRRRGDTDATTVTADQITTAA